MFVTSVDDVYEILVNDQCQNLRNSGMSRAGNFVVSHQHRDYTESHLIIRLPMQLECYISDPPSS